MGHFFGAVFMFILAGIALVGAVFIGLIKVFKSAGKGGETDEEARMIQEIYNSMSRMEERVESLETILLEKEKKQ